MTDNEEFETLKAHILDLRNKSEMWHCPLASSFLDEEELSRMQRIIPASSLVRYDGGYPGARKQKVIFLADEEDDFSDIVCLQAEIDQRFRKISHRDVLGALMHLQIDRHSFGDFWVEEKRICLYTSDTMSRFLRDNLFRINQLSVQFVETDEHPVQTYQMKDFTCIIASTRLDAVVAGITKTSRSTAKEMIRKGLVQVNHVTLEEPDELCNNNVTISIRGYGRFLFLGPIRNTKAGRIAAEFQQFV